MNKRVWGAMIVILGLLLIIGLVYFMFFYESAAPEAEKPAPPAAAAPEAPQAVRPAAAPVIKKAEIKPDDLARMAAAFAERFGSFSNQSDYGNIRDLEIFMTAKMKVWAEDYISQAKAKKTDASIYYGVITKAIFSQASLFDADSGQAEILVKTQRRESAGLAGNGAVYYQDIIIKYSRDRAVWRVDGAYWQVR